MLHLNCTALSQSESSNFSCVLLHFVSTSNTSECSFLSTRAREKLWLISCAHSRVVAVSGVEALRDVITAAEETNFRLGTNRSIN